MKLLRYLKEDVDKELSNIEKNCSQFLKEFKTGRNLFLRVRSDYPQKPNIFVIKGRTDREPKDTPKYIQNKIDELDFLKLLKYIVIEQGNKKLLKNK